jgi:hypothetical protein
LTESGSSGKIGKQSRKTTGTKSLKRRQHQGFSKKLENEFFWKKKTDLRIKERLA